jgi:hypothetical protein
LLRAWLLRACLRAAAGRGLVWVRVGAVARVRRFRPEKFFFINQVVNRWIHPPLAAATQRLVLSQLRYGGWAWSMFGSSILLTYPPARRAASRAPPYLLTPPASTRVTDVTVAHEPASSGRCFLLVRAAPLHQPNHQPARALEANVAATLPPHDAAFLVSLATICTGPFLLLAPRGHRLRRAGSPAARRLARTNELTALLTYPSRASGSPAARPPLTYLPPSASGGLRPPAYLLTPYPPRPPTIPKLR